MAKISRGRTLRQFVLCTLVVPSLYAFLWFGTVGGEALKQQVLADASGLCGKWLHGGAGGNKLCNLADAEIVDDAQAQQLAEAAAGTGDLGQFTWLPSGPVEVAKLAA